MRNSVRKMLKMRNSRLRENVLNLTDVQLFQGLPTFRTIGWNRIASFAGLGLGLGLVGLGLASQARPAVCIYVVRKVERPSRLSLTQPNRYGRRGFQRWFYKYSFCIFTSKYVNFAHACRRSSDRQWLQSWKLCDTWSFDLFPSSTSNLQCQLISQDQAENTVLWPLHLTFFTWKYFPAMSIIQKTQT